MPSVGPQQSAVQIALRAALEAWFVAVGLNPVNVARAYQPTQQGQLPGNVLYFQPFPMRRVGWPQRKDEFDPDTLEFVHEESAQFEQTYQFTALTDPEQPSVQLPQAADILRAASAALQSDTGMGVLRAAGVGVLRVTELRLGYATDDRDQFEAEPSFDVTLTYRNGFTDRIEPVVGFEVEIHRV